MFFNSERYPPIKFRREPGEKLFVEPVVRKLQVWPNLFCLDQFFDSCDEEGCFKIKVLSDSVYFSNVHLRGYVRGSESKLLSLAEAIYGEASKDDYIMGEEFFRKYFIDGLGKIDFVAYGPADDTSFWYKSLYTDISLVARTFSFQDFVNVLDKSDLIIEKKIERYYPASEEWDKK